MYTCHCILSSYIISHTRPYRLQCYDVWSYKKNFFKATQLIYLFFPLNFSYTIYTPVIASFHLISYHTLLLTSCSAMMFDPHLVSFFFDDFPPQHIFHHPFAEIFICHTSASFSLSLQAFTYIIIHFSPPTYILYLLLSTLLLHVCIISFTPPSLCRFPGASVWTSAMKGTNRLVSLSREHLIATSSSTHGTWKICRHLIL